MKDKRKKLQGGLDSLFTPAQTQAPAEPPLEDRSTDQLINAVRPLLGRGRPKKHPADRPAAEKGCKEGEGRFTFVMNKAQAEALKNIAYWERMKAKDVIMQAVADYLQAYETKHGAIKPRKK